MSVNQPREGKVSKLFLKKYNSDIKKPIGPQLVMFSLYEDIQKPSLYAEFQIRDFGNLLQSWSTKPEEDTSNALEGAESIVVTVSDPVNTPIIRDYEFGIVSVTNNSSNPTEMGQVYVIRAISLEHLKNTQKRVMKGYNDKIEVMIEDIIKNYLDSSKKFTKEDQTKDTALITVPRYNAFKTIDMLRKRAVSKRYPNSPYLFYESSDGYNFATIDYIIDNNKKKDIKTYTTKTATEVDFDDNLRNQQYRNIIDYEVVKSFNTYEKISSGAMALEVFSFDVTTKSFTQKKYDVKTAKLPQQTDSKGKLYPDKLYDTFSDPGRSIFLPSSVDVKPTIVENAGEKEIASALFADTVIIIKVAGDTSVTIGEIINVELPSKDDAAKLDRPQFKLDAKYSGNYMITKIRHLFSIDEHDMVLEAVKVGKKS
jgi:hypothetical protein